MLHLHSSAASVHAVLSAAQMRAAEAAAGAPGLTLMRAVAQAKGVNEFARLNDVVVFRTVKGQSLAALYDLDAIRDGTYADPRIYPADVVVVGDTAATRRLLRFVQALPLVTTPLVLALQTF